MERDNDLDAIVLGVGHEIIQLVQNGVIISILGLEAFQARVRGERGTLLGRGFTCK